MQTTTIASTTAYGHPQGAIIIDALCEGKTLEFTNPQGHTIKAIYRRHLLMNRDEIRIDNCDGTGGGIFSEDPFEWFLGKITRYSYTLNPNQI